MRREGMTSALPLSGQRHEVLLQELREENEIRRGDLGAGTPVHERSAAAGPQRSRDPGAEDVLQECCSRDEPREPDHDVAAGADAFDRIEGGLVPERLEGPVARGEEEECGASGECDASLEAASRRDEAEGDQPQGHEERAAHHQRPEDTDGVAAGVVFHFVVLTALAAQQQHDADDGCEEDELLAHRVEAAIVEDRGGHDVGHMPLGKRDTVQDVAVGAFVVTEVGQADEAPDQKRAEARGGGQEDSDPDAAAHSPPSSFGLPARTRATAISTTIGYARPPTTSIDSATSGACRTAKRITSVQP